MSLMDKLLKSGSDAVKASILSESDFFHEEDGPMTPIPAINIALGGSLYGKLKSGLLMIAGASKSFKTCVSLYLLASYLKKYPDAVCLFYDTEFGSTPAYFKNFGIDTDRVIHIPIENLEQLKFDIVNRIKDVTKKEKVFVLIDSVGNIASKKEVEDAMEEKSAADMTRAKQLKGFWRIVTPMFKLRQMPCVAINHIYKEQAAAYPRDIVSGGCLVSGTKIKMASGDLKSVENISVGDSVITLDGEKQVTAIWNPDTLIDGTPECYKITFDDGFEVVCSDKHKFLIDNEWVESRNLKEGDIVWTCE